MATRIEITTKTASKLSSHMRGFESHDNLISFLINFYEYEIGLESFVEPSTSLTIEFEPNNDEEEFKRKLLIKKKAWVHLTKTDGITEIKEWNATKLTEKSNITSNLRSGPLRDWKKKGIVKAKVKFSKIPF